MRLSALSARRHWLLVVGLPLAALAAYYGQSLSTHGDNLLHLYRLVALHKDVVEGNFFPRWNAELFLGFGYPLLNFYASSTYYLAEALHLIGLDYENSLIYALLLLLIFASVGIYRLAADLFADLEVVGNLPALVATAAYIFAPYLLFNVYVRGAIAEVGAQALLPWLLWAFRRLLCSAEPTRYFLFAVFCLAALAYTHTVSLLLAPPVLVAYALVLLWRYRGEPQEWRRRLRWFVAATASAAAISAAFWLPALVEKQFLTAQAQEMAARYLDQHTWNWSNFVDDDWTVAYNDPAGTRLRRLQLLLAVIGAAAWRRRNGEWFFWVTLALVSLLLAGEWAMRFWRSHPLLLTVQFPWRLLGIAGVPLALLTGGILTHRWFDRGVGRQIQVLGLALLTGLIVYVHFPRMAWMDRLQAAPEQTNLTSISQYEAITKRYGLSAATFREFTPRWVTELELQSMPAPAAQPPLEIALERANNRAVEMAVAANAPTRLLFSTLFFPGWQVQLENGTRLEPYPVSGFGLLGVDLPAGEHQLTLRWATTPPRLWGGAITLGALLMLAVFCLRHSALRRTAFLPFLPLVVVGGLMASAPLLAPAYFPTPGQPAQEGLQLLGYSSYQEERDAVYLFPYWHVKQTPTDLLMHWQLLDQSGGVVATWSSFPYFNTLRAFQWSANMVVDDGYYLPLPPSLAAGDYTLALAVTSASDEANADKLPFRPVGQIQIRRDVPALPTLDHDFQVQFQEPENGNQITLRGYSVRREADGRAETQSGATDLTVAPGDNVVYTLYWQAEQAVPVGIQVFHQLLDHTQATLTQVNQPLVLSHGAPYYLWNPYWLRENEYRLQIPEDAAGGLYRPYVGVYDLESEERFAARLPDGTAGGDAVFLPPIKVARRDAPPLANPVAVQLGDAIQLQGVEVALPAGGLQPQATLTLTVQYKSLAPISVDYTQFVHLHSAELGMAAQRDTPPQGNPTSTWVPGEVIVDVIPLTVAEDAKAGRYTLSLGLYDPLAGGARLPVLGEDQQPHPDSRFVIAEIEIQ